MGRLREPEISRDDSERKGDNIGDFLLNSRRKTRDGSAEGFGVPLR